MVDQQELQTGADRVAIQDLMARYAYAVDAKRWELLGEVFASGAEIDFLANGGIKDNWPAIGNWLATAMSGFTACQHYLSNFATEVDGDRANSRFYVFTQMITVQDGS
ncbi:MAG: nuclear transport factor 2 family protein, partial [Pseudomonadales bacterium]|nr:nuclear transport factor 2 family protein [Pseudomonadales bacterium]